MAGRNRQKVARRVSPVRTQTDPSATVAAQFRRIRGWAQRPEIRVAVGVAEAAVAAFMLLALLSFAASDPDFDHAGGGSVANLGGIVGAYLAGALLRAFGIAAYTVPLVLSFAAADRLRPSGYTPLILRLPATALLLFGCAALLSLLGPRATGQGLPIGGWIGHELGVGLIRPFFGIGGAVLLVPAVGLALVGAIGQRGLHLSARVGRALWAALLAAGERLRMVATREARHARTRQTLDAQTAESSEGRSPRPRFVEPPAPSAPPIDPAVATSRSGEDTEPEFKIEAQKVVRPSAIAVQRRLVADDAEYRMPDIDLLDKPTSKPVDVDEKSLRARAGVLEHKIREYAIEGRVLGVKSGPVISMFEFKPAPGVKLSKIANLEDDLAMATESERVRIIAPLPGRDVVGIEIPNRERESVALRSIIESAKFWDEDLRLPFALGRTTEGDPAVADLTAMPHLLIAGATGAGKSVAINALIVSLLYRLSPRDLRLYLIDPKRLELSFYRGVPHLEGHDVVTDPHESLALLDALVREMEDRYEWMAHAKTRNLAGYNAAVRAGKVAARGGDEPREMPYLVCIVDELADLMMVTRKAIEEPIARLAQMARAAGIHLVLATQRPSVDVITGLIKANFPTRIAFKVSSKADARVVLDQQGAENLLGRGDMLFKGPKTDTAERIHGAFVSEEEVTRVVEHWKAEGERLGSVKPAVSEELIQESLDKVHGGNSGGAAAPGVAAGAEDEMFERAVAIAAGEGIVSTSRIQRALGIGYNRAARIMEAMDARGLVGPPEGAGKPRKFLGGGGS